jgi:hypothetical protein
MDDSSSIPRPRHKTLLDFVTKIARSFTGHRQNKFGFLKFSSFPQVIIPLNNDKPISSIEAEILGTEFSEGRTNTHLAISAVINEFSFNPMGTLIMLLITDGIADDNVTAFAAAKEAIKADIVGIAVGITGSEGLLEPLLNAIAGGNMSRVFKMTQFEELISFLVPIRHLVCNAKPPSARSTIMRPSSRSKSRPNCQQVYKKDVKK